MNLQHERRNSIIIKPYINEFHVTLCAGPTIVNRYFFLNLISYLLEYSCSLSHNVVKTVSQNY